MKKIFLSIFVLFLSVSSIFAGGYLFSGSSKIGAEDISTSATFSGGDGTASDPFLVSNETDLLNVVMANRSGKYFKQTQHIDISDKVNVFNSRGNVSFINSYYDGQNYMIYGLKTTQYSFGVGLFANCVNSTLKNIVLENVNINITKFANVKQNSIISTDKSISIGGLCATAKGCTISQCAVMGSITDSVFVSNQFYLTMGSLIGLSQQNKIDECFARTTIGSKYGWCNAQYAYSYCGGLIGGNFFNASIGSNINDQINNCYFLGQINSKYAYAGRLMGCNYNSAVNKCYVMNSYPAVPWIMGFNGGGFFGYYRNDRAPNLSTDLLLFSYPKLISIDHEQPIRPAYETIHGHETNWLVGNYYGNGNVYYSHFILGNFLPIIQMQNVRNSDTSTSGLQSVIFDQDYKYSKADNNAYFSYLGFDYNVWYWNSDRQGYGYNLMSPNIAVAPMLAWYENSYKNIYLKGNTGSSTCQVIRGYNFYSPIINISSYASSLKRDGFVLNGWHTTSTLTTNPANPNNNVISSQIISQGKTDLVLYANWTPIETNVNVKFLVSYDVAANTWQEVESVEDIAESITMQYYSTELYGTGTKLVTEQVNSASSFVMRDCQNIKTSVNMKNSDYVCLGVVKENEIPKTHVASYVNTTYIEGSQTIYVCFKVGSVLKYDAKNKYFYYEYKSHPQTAVITYDKEFDKYLTEKYKDGVECRQFEKDGQEFVILNYNYDSDNLASEAYKNYDGQKFLGVCLNDTWHWLKFEPVVYRVSEVGVEKDDLDKVFDNPILEIKILFNLPIGFEDNL